MKKSFIDLQTVKVQAYRVACDVVADLKASGFTWTSSSPINFYGVPRGGLLPASLVMYYVARLISAFTARPVAMTDRLDLAHIIIDDIYDSGATWRSKGEDDSVLHVFGPLP